MEPRPLIRIRKQPLCSGSSLAVRDRQVPRFGLSIDIRYIGVDVRALHSLQSLSTLWRCTIASQQRALFDLPESPIRLFAWQESDATARAVASRVRGLGHSDVHDQQAGREGDHGQVSAARWPVEPAGMCCTSFAKFVHTARAHVAAYLQVG